MNGNTKNRLEIAARRIKRTQGRLRPWINTIYRNVDVGVLCDDRQDLQDI